MKVTLAILCVLLAVLTQSTNDLRRRYGMPISESYLVRPGVMVTTTFAKSGEICELLIEPERPWTPIKTGAKKLTRKEIDEIADELVPLSQRGQALGGGFINMSCLPDDNCWGSSETYEKVFIYYNVSGKDEYRYATIQWGERACKR